MEDANANAMHQKKDSRSTWMEPNPEPRQEGSKWTLLIPHVTL